MTNKKPARFDPANLNFLGGLLRQFRLVWLLLQDSQVPLWAKAIIPLSVLYLVSPVDFVPDVFLGLGQLDDLGVILLGMALFVKMCPPNLVEYYQSRLEYGPDQHGEAIDTTYQIIDEE